MSPVRRGGDAAEAVRAAATAAAAMAAVALEAAMAVAAWVGVVMALVERDWVAVVARALVCPETAEAAVTAQEVSAKAAAAAAAQVPECKVKGAVEEEPQEAMRETETGL